MKNFIFALTFFILTLYNFHTFSCEKCYQAIIKKRAMCFSEMSDITNYFDDPIPEEKYERYTYLEGSLSAFKESLNIIRLEHGFD